MFNELVIAKLFKFIIVGIGGTFLDFGITYILKEKYNFNKYLANSIGFLSAASSNYFFNRIWAFDDKNIEIFKQYLTFIGISIIGLAILNLFIWLFHEKFRMNFYVAKILALFIVLVWTFGAHYLITFAPPGRIY